MTFWIITLGLAALVAALLVLALIRGKAGAEPPAAYDLKVYRDQMAEVERDSARGVIAPEEVERLKAEIGRRILAADAKLQEQQSGAGQPKSATMAMAALVAVFLLGGGWWMYDHYGAVGYGDLALKDRIEMAEERRADRPSQAQAEAELPPMPNPDRDPKYLELVEKLRAAVEQRPDDLQGQALLVRNEAVLGNFARAHAAQARVLEIKGDEATATDYADYADVLILAAGGYVSPEAETALKQALSRDPKNGTALYYWGLMLTQNDRPDQAFGIWRSLLRQGPDDAAWIPPIRAQIEEIAMRAGVEYTLPPVADAPMLRGPSAEDMQSAAELSDEDRQNMIRGMVANLSERLATEGGTAPEWARLINAYGVLGEQDRAAAIWAEAQGRFAERPDELAAIRAAAEQAGVAQ
ncbi:c-type cytochrome biogenesis protein CcmI [Donghicola sp. XS_ASV15]|uniref:c-type cytochrome biogenesis protein CcmI n=1 Tax=Donghicola sp. XS_ASV15 TaxID=3241295 RepID=UPI003515A2AD